MSRSCLLLTCVAASLATNVAVEAQSDSLAGRIVKLRSALKTGEASQRADAAMQIGDLGGFAEALVPDLVAAATNDKDLATRYEAVLALGRIGEPAASAVKPLTKLLDDSPPHLQYAAATSLRQIGKADDAAVAKLRKLTADKDPLVAVNAAWTLAALKPGDEATLKSVLPLLVKSLDAKSPQTRSDAVAALAGVGTRAVGPLVEHVKDADHAACSPAIDALAFIGPPAKAAVPVLLQRLQDDSESCWHAARALGAIGAEPDAVVPALRKQLSHKSASVRAGSATALGQFGEHAAPAVPELTKLLADREVNVRLAAAEALGEVGPKAKSAVSALDKTLDDAEGTVTLNAAEALGRIGEPAVSVLVKRLQNPAFRTLAAAVLAEIGPEAKAAVPELVKHVAARDRETRIETAIALGSIGPEAKSAIPALRKLLQTPKTEGRAGAAYALVRIDPKGIVPLLEKTVKDADDEMLQMVSAWGLVTLEPENREYVKLALPHLRKALSHEHPVARREAVTALGGIGEPAAEAVPALVEALDAEDPVLRSEIFHTLGEIGPKAKAAIPQAARSLGDPLPQVRTAAMYFLGQLGGAAKPAVPGLQRIVQQSDGFEKTVAAWALVKIDPKPQHVESAVPLLIATLDRDDPHAREEAAKTLGEIGRNRPEVVAALEKRKADEDEGVRRVVAEALKKLQK